MFVLSCLRSARLVVAALFSNAAYGAHAVKTAVARLRLLFPDAGGVPVALLLALFGWLALPALEAQTVSTFATGFNGPYGLTLDAAGNLYVANVSGDSVSKVTPAGVVSTFATGFSTPYGGVAFDSAGNLYVSNFGSDEVSKVTPGGVVSSFATGLSNPMGLAFDAAGNLYVANYGNNTVSKITAGGVVSTFASGGFSLPYAVAFDSAGNLYVSNLGSQSVSKVTTGGVVSTFATGLNGPFGLALDGAGNLYVPNLYTGVVSKVTPAGVVSTFLTGLGNPAGLAFDVTGNLYVGDVGNSTVKKVTLVVAPTISGVTGPGAATYKAGSSLNFTVTFSSAVVVTGSPHIELTVGSTTQYGSYASGNGTTSLVFTYTVQAGDTDANGIAMTSPLDANCGTIEDLATSVAAVLTFTAPATGSVLVDTTAPTITSGASASATFGSAFSSYSLAATDAATLTYGASGLPPGLSVNPATGAITGTPTAAGSYTTTVTASDVAGNVTSASVGFTVNRATPAVTWSAPFAITYGTAISPTQLNATASVAGALIYTPTTGSLLGAGSQTLGVIFTPTDAGNYNSATGSVSLTVNRALLTVIAAAKSKIYGAANPALAATITGFVNSETLGTSGVSGAATVTTAATTTTAVGFAAITPSLGTLAASNYTFASFTPGILTITSASLSVSGATAAGKVYDGTVTATPVFATAELSGLSAGDVGNVTLATTAASATFADKTVGTAKAVMIAGVTLSGPAAGNYTLAQPTGAVATIASKPLSVTGLTASNKIYDANTSAPLTATAAALVGVVGGDTVTLVTGGMSGAFTSASVGSAKPVTLMGLALAGADSANYVLNSFPVSADITPAVATITLGSLAQVYSGAARVVTATTSPAGLTANLTYAGSATAPSVAGSYAVVATISDPNYLGSASGTLNVARAAQTISFASIGATTVGRSIPLLATASSGLLVTFNVASGSASITGGTLTMASSGAATIRATQSGDANYSAVSVNQIVSGAARLEQTITFAALDDRPPTAPAMAVTAAASSGLPVTFTIVSGPAMLAGGMVTLTGAPGDILISATQGGDAVYLAAPAVTRTFSVSAVGPLVFFGTLDTAPFAAEVGKDGKSGTMIGTIPGTGEAFVVNFTIDANGVWSGAGATYAGTSTASVGIAGRSALSLATPDEAHKSVPASGALITGTRVFRGRVDGGVFTGRIDGLSVVFAADLVPPSGPTASTAGYYQSSSLQTSTGAIYSIVGSTNQVYVLAITSGYVGGNLGTADAGGAYTVQLSPSAVVAGTIDATTTAVTGTIARTDAPTESFAGLAVTTVRTDRMLNLSSRSQVDAAGSQLIAGFVIGGSEPKMVLLRAVGPSLASFGVSGELTATRLRLFDGQGILLREVDGWRDDPATAAAFARVGAFRLSEANTDSALLVSLAPGAYTLHIVPRPNGSGGAVPVAGVALAEIYDASVNPRAEYQRLINISTRGSVRPGDGVLIGGFVITGNSPKRVLVRGVGPGLAAFGVGDLLGDPTLTLYAGGRALARNDNWGTPVTIGAGQTAASPAEIMAATKAVGGFALGSDSRDSAVIVTLAPGAYTAHLAGVASSAGNALIEIYEIPN